MSEKQIENAVEMLSRSVEHSGATVELVLDNSNKISFPDYPYLLEALGKKILVSIDIFKSGYECRECKGKRRIEHMCQCEEAGHPGTRYGAEEIAAIRASISDEVADQRAAMVCPKCEGSFASLRSSETCSKCKGLGALLVLPETSKNLPTTGVVLSIGNRVNKAKINYKVGDRILFGPYAGSMIPTKGGLLFKVLDANNAWCRVDGANELGAFEFILNEDSE